MCTPPGGTASFLTTVFRRVRDRGRNRPMVVRADSGFYNRKVTQACAAVRGGRLITGEVVEVPAGKDGRHRRSDLDAHPVLDARRR